MPSATSPVPSHESSPSIPNTRVLTRGVLESEAPFESDFVGAMAIARYRESVSRLYITERGWTLADYGETPIAPRRMHDFHGLAQIAIP